MIKQIQGAGEGSFSKPKIESEADADADNNGQIHSQIDVSIICLVLSFWLSKGTQLRL